MSFHLRFGTGRGFRKPLYVSCKALAYQQVWQLETYLYIILYIFGQQYSYQSSSRVFSQPRWPATSRLYIYLRSLSLSLLWLGTTKRFLQYRQFPQASHLLREILLKRLAPSQISLSVSQINLLFGYLLVIICLMVQSVISKTYTIRSLVGGLNSLGRSRV